MLPRYPNKTAHLKSPGFFMSVWNVGNAGCPPKANTIVPNAMKKGSNSVVECRTGSHAPSSIATLITSRTHATAVAKVAPTATGLSNKKYQDVIYLYLKSQVLSQYSLLIIKRAWSSLRGILGFLFFYNNQFQYMSYQRLLQFTCIFYFPTVLMFAILFRNRHFLS